MDYAVLIVPVARPDAKPKLASKMRLKLIKSEGYTPLVQKPILEFWQEIKEADLLQDPPTELVEDETPRAPASDINDKLDRIRAVVAQTQAADDDDFSEDEHAEDLIDIPDVAGFEDEADGAGDDAVEAMLDARAAALD